MSENRYFAYTFGNVLKISFPLIIFFSIIKVVSYYSQFNVSIIHFINIGELPLFFLEDLGMYVLLLIPVVAFSIEIMVKNERVSSLIKWIGGILMFVFLLYDILFGSYGLLWIVVFSFSSFLPFYIVSNKLPHFIKDKKNYDEILWVILGGLFTVFLILTMIKAITDANDVKKVKTYFGTQIIFNDSTRIESDSSFYYIGKIENYVFVFDEKSNKTYSYPISTVKRISIIKKKRRIEGVRPHRTPIVSAKILILFFSSLNPGLNRAKSKKGLHLVKPLTAVL
ncbi:MAG TPA: hypothetical protein VI461_00275 [Chitinophagaceae bacterium]|nr:hypothetical protein [Chitinophagaceae bacterium]